jgi:hypothetical protein
MPVPIIGTIITGIELEKKIKKVCYLSSSCPNTIRWCPSQVDDMPIPAPPKELTDKFRWLQCTVKNETQFQVFLLDTYLQSGRYWNAPSDFGQFDQLVYCCCSDDYAPTGVSGGTAFRLRLDDQHYFNFALVSKCSLLWWDLRTTHLLLQGWSNPLVGPYKVGVVASSFAKEGYDSAGDYGVSLISQDVFEGKDKEGNTAKFLIHISAAPSQKSFVVAQVPVWMRA